MLPLTTHSLVASFAVLFSLMRGGGNVNSNSNSNTNNNVVLWNSGSWPYAQRSWIALKEKGVPFEHKIIDLSDKPQEFLDKYARVSPDKDARAKVPLLEHGDRYVIESADVVKYIAQNIAGKTITDDRMYPLHDKTKRQQMDRFLEIWDKVVEQYVSFLRAENEPQVQEAKPQLVAALEALDEELAKFDDVGVNTSSLFLSGDIVFSAAECIAAPWILRLYAMIPYFRGVQVQDLIPAHCQKVGPWMEAIKNRQSVIESSPALESLIAASKRYFVTYITPGSPGDQSKEDS